MHTYRQLGEIWEVGYYFIVRDRGAIQLAVHHWHRIASYRTENSAARLVNYLNGGTGDGLRNVSDDSRITP